MPVLAAVVLALRVRLGHLEDARRGTWAYGPTGTFQGDVVGSHAEQHAILDQSRVRVDGYTAVAHDVGIRREGDGANVIAAGRNLQDPAAGRRGVQGRLEDAGIVAAKAGVSKGQQADGIRR